MQTTMNETAQTETTGRRKRKASGEVTTTKRRKVKKNAARSNFTVEGVSHEELLERWNLDWWRGRLGESWVEALEKELKEPYLLHSIEAVHRMRQQSNKIFPPDDLVFNAFKTTPLHAVQVVIMGQDPYHQRGNAMGFAFGVPRSAKIPGSLRNIFKEIGIQSSHGDLTHWAEQGVLLLNSTLTVEEAKAASHKHLGWSTFTDMVVSTVSLKRDGVVFLLWGQHALAKAELIDGDRHLVLTSAHPSPLSARDFLGCGHFERCNEYLKSRGLVAVDWSLPQDEEKGEEEEKRESSKEQEKEKENSRGGILRYFAFKGKKQPDVGSEEEVKKSNVDKERRKEQKSPGRG